jgi:hypothetical protein
MPDRKRESRARARSGSGAAKALPLGWVTGLVAVYALTCLLWEGLGWGSAGPHDLIGNLALLPLHATLVVLLLLASGRTTLEAGVRLALRFFAAGFGVAMIGSGVLAFSMILLQRNPPGYCRNAGRSCSTWPWC